MYGVGFNGIPISQCKSGFSNLACLKTLIGLSKDSTPADSSKTTQSWFGDKNNNFISNDEWPPLAQIRVLLTTLFSRFWKQGVDLDFI